MTLLNWMGRDGLQQVILESFGQMVPFVLLVWFKDTDYKEIE